MGYPLTVVSSCERVSGELCLEKNMRGQWRGEVRQEAGITDIRDYLDATSLCEDKISWATVAFQLSETRWLYEVVSKVPLWFS